MKEFEKIERMAYAAKELAAAIMDVDFGKASKVLELVDDTEFSASMAIIREAIGVKVATEPVNAEPVNAEPVNEVSVSEPAVEDWPQFEAPDGYVRAEGFPSVLVNKEGDIIIGNKKLNGYEFSTEGSAVITVPGKRGTRKVRVDKIMVSTFFPKKEQEIAKQLGLAIIHDNGNRADCRLNNLRLSKTGSTERNKLTYHDVEQVCKSLIQNKFNRSETFRDLHYNRGIHHISNRNMSDIIHKRVPDYEDLISRYF
jgi:hypothetical protein